MFGRQIAIMALAVGGLSTQGTTAPPAPFVVGGQLVYDLRLKLGVLSLGRVGTGRMEVAEIESVRGRLAYHLVFTVQGGTIGFRVDDRYESWVDIETFASLRHVQRIHEGGYSRNTTYEFYPSRATYTKNGGEERPSVEFPLDDGSFVYYLRTLAMQAGERREVHRYFKPAQNPVVLVASRTDRISVPAGRFDAIVLQPAIRGGGLFADGGRAELWMSTGAQPVMVRMITHLSFGTIELSLRSIVTGQPVLAAASATSR